MINSGYFIKGSSLPTTTDYRHDVKASSLSQQDPRIQYLEKYGSFSMAYSTLQPGLDYFFTEFGYLAFTQVKFPFNTIHVLGDPVSKPENKKIILELFFNYFPQVAFSQITRETGVILKEDFDYFVTNAGYETIISVPNFRIKGNKKKDLKRYRNSCSNILVKEVFEIPVNIFRGISKQWIGTKRVALQEMKYLTRPMIYEPEYKVRYFAGFLNNQILGFNVYDPIFREGKIIGYQTVIQRHFSDVPMGISDYINFNVIDVLKKENVEILSLGFSPFAKPNKNPDYQVNPSAFTEALFDRFYLHGNNIYSFQGLAQHKRRYRGNEVPVYFANKNKNSLLEIFDIYRLCGVISLNNINLLAPKNLIALRKMFFS